VKSKTHEVMVWTAHVRPGSLYPLFEMQELCSFVLLINLFAEVRIFLTKNLDGLFNTFPHRAPGTPSCFMNKVKILGLLGLLFEIVHLFKFLPCRAAEET
jgi:hypothetical protein